MVAYYINFHGVFLFICGSHFATFMYQLALYCLSVSPLCYFLFSEPFTPYRSFLPGCGRRFFLSFFLSFFFSFLLSFLSFSVSNYPFNHSFLLSVFISNIYSSVTSHILRVIICACKYLLQFGWLLIHVYPSRTGNEVFHLPRHTAHSVFIQSIPMRS